MDLKDLLAFEDIDAIEKLSDEELRAILEPLFKFTRPADKGKAVVNQIMAKYDKQSLEAMKGILGEEAYNNLLKQLKK